jgi:hypothetical protein
MGLAGVTSMEMKLWLAAMLELAKMQKTAIAPKRAR